MQAHAGQSPPKRSETLITELSHVGCAEARFGAMCQLVLKKEVDALAFLLCAALGRRDFFLIALKNLAERALLRDPDVWGATKRVDCRLKFSRPTFCVRFGIVGLGSGFIPLRRTWACQRPLSFLIVAINMHPMIVTHV